jgi:hypothetical protein
LHKSLCPRALTLPFQPVRFWLRILGDIRIRKSTPRIGDSGESFLNTNITANSKPKSERLEK